MKPPRDGLRTRALALLLLGCSACGPPQDRGHTADDAPTTTAGTPAAVIAGADEWETYTDPGRGISFRYPPHLDTVYIEAFDWPPKADIRPGQFSCTEAGSVRARAGKTEHRDIGGEVFCVTRVDEGAAGSVYSQYAYAFARDVRVVTLTFTLRAVQCGNYDDPKKTRCEQERAAFDIDPVIAGIAATLRIGN